MWILVRGWGYRWVGSASLFNLHTDWLRVKLSHHVSIPALSCSCGFLSSPGSPGKQAPDDASAGRWRRVSRWWPHLLREPGPLWWRHQAATGALRSPPPPRLSAPPRWMEDAWEVWEGAPQGLEQPGNKQKDQSESLLLSGRLATPFFKGFKYSQPGNVSVGFRLTWKGNTSTAGAPPTEPQVFSTSVISANQVVAIGS